MGLQRTYLRIAVALTALDLRVAFRYGAAVWRAYADSLPLRLLLLLFVAVWITNLTDLWSRAIYRLRKRPRLRHVRLSEIVASTAAKAEASNV